MKNKLLIPFFTIATIALFSFTIYMANCIYCGGGPVGTSCSKSPSGKCVVIQEGKCSYCGSGLVGTSCSKSPTKKCIVPKAGKCSYCGSGLIGTSCFRSPSGKCACVQY
jgi:hypothetical protein